jgi:hypothetical protein
MNDDFRNAIKRLRDVYNYLTEGEPSPDEEEESQREMITLLESLIMHIPTENMEENLELLKTSLNQAKGWDTLEYWFKEKPDLVTNIKLILNRFLIRHVEPGLEEKPAPQITTQNGVPDELSTKLAAALDRAMKNLPPDADVTKVIQSVTSQVTESYNESKNTAQPKVGLGGVPIAEKSEVSEGSSSHSDPKIPHNPNSITSTAARVKIRKEDIMKSVLEQVKNNISDSSSSSKLAAPKIIIPKVTKPKQKIIPYKEELVELSTTEQKQQQLEAIPQIKPQETPKKAPKLKVGAFKKEKTLTAKIKTSASAQPQEPIRPKVVVKPRIKTKVEEIKPPKSQPIVEPKPEPPVKEQPQTKTAPPKPKKPKIKIQAKPVSKSKQKEIPKESESKSAIKFNVVKPTKTSVKDTQVDLFETFTKQEKKTKRRRSRKKSKEQKDSTPPSEEKQNLDASDAKESQMKGVQFPEETIPYEKMDKPQLYQELIALEGKKYAIEKSRKDFKAKHEKGLISDGNYAAQLDRFKFDLQYISKKINEIRNRIQAL